MRWSDVSGSKETCSELKGRNIVDESIVGTMPTFLSMSEEGSGLRSELDVLEVLGALVLVRVAEPIDKSADCQVNLMLLQKDLTRKSEVNGISMIVMGQTESGRVLSKSFASARVIEESLMASMTILPASESKSATSSKSCSRWR